MSNKMMYQSELETAASPQALNGRVNGNGHHTGLMSLELLQQFQTLGVTVPLPHSFADAISPHRGQNGKDTTHTNGHIS